MGKPQRPTYATSSAFRWRQRSVKSDAKTKDGFLEQYWKPIFLCVISSLVAFFVGQWSEGTKLRAQDERLAIENRRRVFVSTAQELGVYLTQWGRLRSIAPAEEKLRIAIAEKESILRSSVSSQPRPQVRRDLKALSDELERVVKRKERYLEGRDAARDRLSGNLEQARLFYGELTNQEIVLFEKFERAHGNKRLSELPPPEQWREHAAKIFSAMSKEIRDDESRLAKAPISVGPR